MADDEKAPKGSECPCCGEDRIDYLLWVRGDLVQCTNCGLLYELRP